jgi:DNA adenine methylase
MAISYIGGKARIGKWIVNYIPTDIETYCEPFSGQFWVFFNMDLKKYPKLKTVIYNDFNSLNANLYKCIKFPDELWNELSKYPTQELGVENTPPIYGEMFKQYQKEVFDINFKVGNEPNFDAAAKYAYVLCSVFSGSKPETATFMDYKGKYRSKVLILMDKLKNDKYREHFDKITFVENLDFEDCIKKYDSKITYFYLDPPYYGSETYYSKHDFNIVDHLRLSNVLKNIRGNFSLSYYDFPDLIKFYPKDTYTWEQKDFAKASAAKKGAKQTSGTEVLIMNYPEKNKELILNNRTYSGYLFLFDQVDLFGNIYHRDSFDYKSLDNLKIRGTIEDYKIDKKGVKIINAINIQSFDI